MTQRENIWIPKLKEQLSENLISRREFIRHTTLLGMSAGAAYMWAGKITGNPIAAPARAAAQWLPSASAMQQWPRRQATCGAEPLQGGAGPGGEAACACAVGLPRRTACARRGAASGHILVRFFLL